MAAMEGMLSKWTNVMKGWQFRWFVLDDNAGLLSYYTSRDKMIRGVRRGCVRLKGAVIGIDDENESTFTITVDGKTFHFHARDAEEREKWTRALEDTILRHAHKLRWDPNKLIPSVQDFDKKLVEADAYLQILIDQVKRLEEKIEKMQDPSEKAHGLHIRDLTNAMLEYVKHSIVLLQIAKNTAHPVNGIFQPPALGYDLPAKTDLSSQVTSFAQGGVGAGAGVGPDVRSASSCGTAASGAGAEEAADSADARRHEGDGDMGSGGGGGGGGSGEGSGGGGGGTTAHNRSPGLHLPPNSLPIKIALSGLPSGGAGHTPTMSMLVPDVSYTSSEDEDFYDANDYASAPSSPLCSGSMPPSSASTTLGHRPPSHRAPGHRAPGPPRSQLSEGETDGHSAASGGGTDEGESDTGPDGLSGPYQLPLLPDGSIDYDALYEENGEDDLDLSASHGSVVTHLLSQVKIGMDLTRVVLPTFILERRSLLEMYSDYFAHPDYFVKITDFKDPKDRMVHVVRWYMSAYHAGRKSSVAKKPYNPILGEIFYCHWDIPGSSHAGADADTDADADVDADTNADTDADPTSDGDELATDGPVPWCSKNQLTFIAEQVSHHPPISAFYAEHYNKRISFCAHVWTKSKFLGLSVGVHNIGQGCVSVLDYDEEYIVTFPNGYGRSILTTPWIELGGPVTITCAKTGFNANIEFHTKPFYGGKKHRITGEVYQPGDKKPFLTISGEWNGSMHAKWADGTCEVFLNVNDIPIEKKHVRPISEQMEFESRRLWKEVTAGLRINDIEMATNAKTELEQRQREGAKMRKERNIKWETKCFRENGDNWVYAQPLLNRLPPRLNDSTAAEQR